MAKTAKLLLNGRSQAVRLPAQYRFEGKEVFIRRDEATGDVVLSRRPGSWQEFFALADATNIPNDFLKDRGDETPQDREPF